MTISYVEPVKTYVSSGNGNYPFTFKILAESDINVWYTSASTGERAQLVRGSDFSVTVSNPGGTVTILGNAPAGGQIRIERRVPIDQPTDWVNNGPFDMDLLEADLDRIIMIVQQLGWDVSSGQAAINYRGPWATTTTYTSRDIVRTSNGNYYFCIVNHTSGTFATDLAAGNWVLLIDFEAIETHATNAAASEVAAGLSETNAAASETAAGLSEVNAAASAAAAAADADEIRDWPVRTGLATDVAAHLAFSRKNLLINGGFDVWQRGTSFTPSSFGISICTADRWLYDPSSIATVTVSRQSLTPDSTSGLFTSLYFLRTTLAGTRPGSQYVRHHIEGLHHFSGKTATLSYYVKTSAASYGWTNPILNMVYEKTYDPTDHYVYGRDFGTLPSSGVWQKRTRVFDIPEATHEALTSDSYLEVFFVLGTDNATFSIDIANVQLEFGDTATDFEYRHPAEELMLCQRYYETGTLRGPFSQYNPAFAVGPYCPFLVQKRVAPEVATGELTTMGQDGTPGALHSPNATIRGFTPLYNWTGGTVGRSFFGQLTWTADAEIY